MAQVEAMKRVQVEYAFDRVNYLCQMGNKQALRLIDSKSSLEDENHELKQSLGTMEAKLRAHVEQMEGVLKELEKAVSTVEQYAHENEKLKSELSNLRQENQLRCVHEQRAGERNYVADRVHAAERNEKRVFFK